MTDWLTDRFNRLPITEVSDEDLQAAAKTYRGWAQQIECGNNFIYASGQAGALAKYKDKQRQAEVEIKRRASDAAAVSDSKTEI